MNEVSYIITGERRGCLWYGRLQQRQVGQPVTVEFDWRWTLARETQRGDILGFYHTHPGDLSDPSRRDIITMRAWVSCLGKPLLCLIKSQVGLAAYLFCSDEDAGQRLAETQRFSRNVIVCYGVI